MIDFRSDTFTKPTAGMLAAMIQAPVGDDVFGEDPSVNALEAKMAALFHQEAALFCPTGTMSNQIAIKCHTQPGDEVICEKQAHVYIYEGGGIAFHSGAQVKAIEGELGQIKAAQIVECINPDDVHKARTSLVCIENTSNRGGGSCYDFHEIENISKTCRNHQLKLHLDGARLFNALAVGDETEAQYGAQFDSISICFNKGMGCPIGSVLIGSKAFIKQARRVRKVMGGGMRQAGYMAAAGLYALEHHRERLKQDHAHAQYLSEELLRLDFVGHMLPVETNIIIFEIRGRKYQAASFVDALKSKGILCLPISDRFVRMVTHLDIHEDMIHHTVKALQEL
jgi:threonine aldolase